MCPPGIQPADMPEPPPARPDPLPPGGHIPGEVPPRLPGETPGRDPDTIRDPDIIDPAMPPSPGHLPGGPHNPFPRL